MSEKLLRIKRISLKIGMMKNKINLYWYRHNIGHGNFGDELNPYIINKISDRKIIHVDIEFVRDDKILALKILLKNYITGNINFTMLLKYLYFNFIKKPHLLLAIGSVLQFCKSSKTTVWGSGMLSSNSTLPDANYLAVRGYKTINRISELGFKAPDIVGDPALILPLLYKSKNEKKYKIGIIPHYIHYNKYTVQFQDDIIIINLLDKIEDIIDQINQCELTISTSLHGIIVSHAYGVKSIWAIDKEKKLSGDNIKFSDYFSSVNIKEYTPIDIDEVILNNAKDTLYQIDYKFKEILLPKKEVISKVQKNLLEVFPYKNKSN